LETAATIEVHATEERAGVLMADLEIPVMLQSGSRSTGLDVVRAYLELGKARLCSFIVLTAGVAFILADRAAVDWTRLAWTLLGTGLAALGANALNQWCEVGRDACMARTCRRPLPTQRLTRRAALAFGLLTGFGGPLLLAVTQNKLAGGLALAALVLYVGLYTPMKLWTPLNTLVGAVVGALPPLIGWAAANGRLDAGAWILAGVLFLWQIPHFLALACLYREDYARSGFRMLPVVDQQGYLTGHIAVLYTLALLPVAALLTLAGVAGWTYACGSLVLGATLLVLSLGLQRQRSRLAARRLFVGSLVYLPVLLALLVAGGPR
jgi:heme o synthase